MSNPRATTRSEFSLSRRKKALFALVFCVGCFAAMELLLTVLGFDSGFQNADPQAGFSRQVPLLQRDVDSDGKFVMRTAANKLIWFNQQSFPLEKPKNTRRVFCVGGSTTYGRPFSDSTSYCAWLREMLPMVDPDHHWEVINAGGISYASYRVAATMEELARYQPDLFIVYTGHNEFLERRTYQDLLAIPEAGRDAAAWIQKTRLGSLVFRAVRAVSTDDQVATRRQPRDVSMTNTVAPSGNDGLETQSRRPRAPVDWPDEVDEILNHSVGPVEYHRDDTWKANVIADYRRNIRKMIRIARNSGATIVFVTPESNLRDCSPFKSELEESIDDADSTKPANESLDHIQSLLDAGQFQLAWQACRSWIRLQPRHALGHFLAGRALFGMERYDLARAAFQRAVDEDVCPLRAISSIKLALREETTRAGVPLVDFGDRLSQLCRNEFGHDCFGNEYFLDHVHPTVAIHGRIAYWVLETLGQHDIVTGTSIDEHQFQIVSDRIDARIDIETQATAFRNLAKVLHWAGKFREASRHAENALRLAPDDLESRFVLADCLTNLGMEDQALAEYRELFSRGDFPRAYLPMGELLLSRGQWEEAIGYLVPATLTEREDLRTRAHYMLGLAHLGLQQYDLAVETLAIAQQLNPIAPEIREVLDEARILADSQRQTPLAPTNAGDP